MSASTANASRTVGRATPNIDMFIVAMPTGIIRAISSPQCDRVAAAAGVGSLDFMKRLFRSGHNLSILHPMRFRNETVSDNSRFCKRTRSPATELPTTRKALHSEPNPTPFLIGISPDFEYDHGVVGPSLQSPAPVRRPEQILALPHASSVFTV